MKYYHIQYTSDHIWREDQYIKVKSEKRLIERVKQELEDLKRYYLDKKQFKYIHKRKKISNMYIDTKNGNNKVVGKTINLTGIPKKWKDDEDMFKDYIITAWIYKIPKKDLLDNFDELD